MCDVARVAGPTGDELTPSRAAARSGPVALALCGVQFVDVLGVTVVITALPRMLTDLGATTAEGTAIVTAYAMFFGGLLMVAARLGDRFGHRRTVLWSLGVFAAASVLGALAPSVWLLVASRALQGVAAAASVPAALRLLTTVVPDGPARRRAVAGWSAAGAAAGAAGFVVGGVLTEFASWRAVFWSTIGLAVVLAVAVLRTVPRDPPRPAPTAIGWPSAVLLTGAAMGLVAGTTLLGEHGAVLLGAGVTAFGALAAVGFALVEGRARQPLVDAAARRAPVLRWGALGSFANTATTSSSITLAALVLQDDLRLTPLQAAGLLVTVSVLAVVGSALAPRLLGTLGWGPTLGCGLGTVAAGNLLLCGWPSVIGVGVASALCGLGLGIGSVAANDMGTAVDEAIKATAAGVLNTAAQLGTAIGTSVVLLVAAVLDPRPAWAVAAALAAVAGLLAARRAPRARPRGAGRTAPVAG